MSYKVEYEGGLSIKKVLGGVSLAAIALLGASVVFGSWYTVNQTERGVLLRNGSAISKPIEPGLGFKWPIVDTVEKFIIKTATYSWDKMDAYSFDQQPAHLKISVTLRASPSKVVELYSEYGSLDAAVKNKISPVVNQQTKIVFGQFTAVRAVQSRETLNLKISEAIQAALPSIPVDIESVQLENVEFSPTYLKSIEDRMLAEVEVQRLEQNSAREKVQAQITVTKAKAEADATRARAEADGAAIEIRGNAEAMAIKARAEALAANSNLVLLTQAEKWDGKLPQTMVPGGALPMISLGTTPAVSAPK